MIHHVSGTVSHKQPTSIVVEANGVGYLIHTPSTYAEKCTVGETVSVLTTLVVREDAMDIYGFESSSQRDVFGLLTSISGIGPRTAIGIMSAVSLADFVSFIRNEEAARLQKLPGIGKKTAERLILELRDKIHSIVTGAAGTEDEFVPTSDVAEESILALIALGYTRASAKKAVAAALKSVPDANVEAVIRMSFSYLMK